MTARTEPDPTRETRAPLSRDRVLQAAIALADGGGIESLSMRKLAQELGVEAMSLYHYVSGKDDILDEIVEIVIGEIDLAPGGSDWKATMRRSAISAYEVLLRHSWACSLILSRAGVRPARMRYMESILWRLRQAGFSTAMTHHGYHALDSHIMGFTMWEAGIMAGTEDLSQSAATFLEGLAADEYPYLIEHIQHHLAPSRPDDVGEFEFGLDLLLDGLERTLKAP